MSPACSFSVFEPVSQETVTSVIRKSPSKSCSLDPLPTSLLKVFVDKISIPITFIVNWSFSFGVFPSSLKHGLVFPRIKKETLDPDNLKNYRPITNLPFLSKTLERLATTQLNQYLNDNGLYSEMQSAYRANYSTETALVRVCNDVNIALDTHSEVILVLLDLSSAFDTIDHNILITRLRDDFGINGTVLEWMKSYLCNRTRAIVIDGSQSMTSPVDRGVPQGSVLNWANVVLALHFSN